MGSSQTSVDLIARADQCLGSLQGLIERTEKASRTHRTPNSTNLLSNVGKSAKDSSRLLQSWKRDSAQGTVTDDQEFINTTVGLFENLQEWIEFAYDALQSRLYYRKAFLIGWLSSKR